MRAQSTAWVVVAIVFLNTLALGAEYWPGLDRAVVLGSFGLIPSRFMHWAALGGSVHDPWRYLPLCTSMFLHDGWVHLATNMLYLWTFGRALEDRLGRAGLVATYLLAGIAAALGQLIAHPRSNAAMIGASGAIAGLLGAYLVCFPRAKVTVAFPFFLVPFVIEVRAFWFLLAWFGLQVGKGAADLMSATQDPQVAWWAHATGFVAGVTGALAGRAWQPLLPPMPVPSARSVPAARTSLAEVRPSLVPVRPSRIPVTVPTSLVPLAPELRASVAP